MKDGDAIVTYGSTHGDGSDSVVGTHKASISEQEVIFELSKEEVQVVYALAENSPTLPASIAYVLPCGVIEFGQIAQPPVIKTGLRATTVLTSPYPAATEKKAYSLFASLGDASIAEQKDIKRQILETYGKELTESDQLVLDAFGPTVTQAIDKIVGSNLGLSYGPHYTKSHIADYLLEVYPENATTALSHIELNNLRAKVYENRSNIKSKVLIDRSSLRDPKQIKQHVDL